MTGWHVETGDALDCMQRLEAGSVDAIVTSPPYADQRGYSGDERPRGNGETASAIVRNRSRRQRSAAPAEWVEWLDPYLQEMLRVVSPTGSLMLNLGVILRDGEEHPCVDEVVRRAREHGWRLLHRLVWHKPNGQVPSAACYVTIAHEFVFWLAPTTKAWRAYEQPEGSQPSREVRQPHAEASVRRIAGPYIHNAPEGPYDERYAKRSAKHRLHPDGARPTSVLVAGVGGEPNPNQHPARMALPVALHLVALCCPPDGLVLDPFCGDGTTAIAARRRGRRFLGFELRERIARGARERIAGDAPLLDGAEDPGPGPEQLLLDG